MNVVISLLRGINVGGRHKIPMDDLRKIFESLGLPDVLTYVQSGNVVFRTTERDVRKLAASLERAVENRFGFHSDVIQRTCPELSDIVARNPFPERAGLDPGKLAVTFLSHDPGPKLRADVEALRPGNEELIAARRELYIYFPDGMGRSRLPALIERTLKIPVTTRNWNTVTKLLAMAQELESR